MPALKLNKDPPVVVPSPVVGWAVWPNVLAVVLAVEVPKPPKGDDCCRGAGVEPKRDVVGSAPNENGDAVAAVVVAGLENAPNPVDAVVDAAGEPKPKESGLVADPNIS